MFEGKTVGKQGDDRSPQYHAECIPGDHMPGSGDRNPYVAGKLSQHTHNTKFSHAEAEGA
ncbi:hypothetical protein D3C81_2314180 [compost metagenome]